jgi:ABC-type transport system substrate-binding protein
MTFATDKEELLLEACGEDNEDYINYGPFPHNSHKLYRDFEDKFSYNIDSAETELHQSQYDGTPLTIIFPQEYGTIGEKIAFGFKHMMNEIGVQVEATERGLDFYSALDGRAFQIALVYEDDFDRHYHINPLYLSDDPQNVTGIKDSELDGLLEEWGNEIIMTKKLPIAKAIHEKISEICPYIYLFTPPQRAYFSKRLRNVSIIDANSLLASVHKWEIILDE